MYVKNSYFSFETVCTPSLAAGVLVEIGYMREVARKFTLHFNHKIALFFPNKIGRRHTYLQLSRDFSHVKCSSAITLYVRIFWQYLRNVGGSHWSRFPNALL